MHHHTVLILAHYVFTLVFAGQCTQPALWSAYTSFQVYSYKYMHRLLYVSLSICRKAAQELTVRTGECTVEWVAHQLRPPPQAACNRLCRLHTCPCQVSKCVLNTWCTPASAKSVSGCQAQHRLASLMSNAAALLQVWVAEDQSSAVKCGGSARRRQGGDDLDA